MRSSALPLLVVALLTAVVWGLYSWLDESTWSEPPGNTGPRTARQEGRETRLQQGAARHADTTGERTRLSDQRPDGKRPTGDRGPASIPKDARTVTIQVVVAETDTPVPHAEVAAMHRIFDWTSMSDAEREVVNRFGRDDFQIFKHFGNTYEADDEGKLTLPISRILVLASAHAGLYGELFLNAETLEETTGHRLLLRPDQSLRLRVVDGAGKPLPDMSIWLDFLWSKDPDDKRRLRWWTAQAQAITNDDGEAKLTHIQEWLEHHPKDDRPDRAVVGLTITGLIDDTPAFTFDPLAPPRDVVELVAPPTGSVTVRVLGSEQTPVGTYEDIRLRLQPRDKTWSGRPAGDGSARYPYVALGKTFVATAAVELDVEPRTFLGPTRPGDKVQVELRAEATGVHLVGRLLAADQKPIGRSHVRLVYEAEQGNGGCWLFSTQADGRFQIDFDDQLAGLRLTRCVLQQFSRYENTSLLAEVCHPVPLRIGRNDIGNIVLRGAPVLAAGTVQVDGKPPTELVDLAVEWCAEGGSWRQLETAAVAFPKPGRFEICGLARPGRHRLVPGARDCLPCDPLEFQPGQQDLLVALSRGGSLRAKILMDDPTWVTQIAFTLSAQNPTPERTRALTWRGRPPGGRLELIEPDGSGLLAWRGLEPGEYCLQAHVAGAARPLVDLHNLEVPPGGACGDTRLRPVDLRGKLRTLRVTIRDASGEPWKNKAAAAWAETESVLRMTIASTVVRDDQILLLVAGPVDLHVAAQGFEPVLLEGITRDTTVRLRRLQTVSLRVPAVTPPPGTKLLLAVEAHGLPIDRVCGRKGLGAFAASRYVRPQRRVIELGQARTVSLAVRQADGCDLRVVLDYANRWTDVEGIRPTRMQLGSDQARERRLEIPAGAIEAAARKARAR